MVGLKKISSTLLLAFLSWVILGLLFPNSAFAFKTYKRIVSLAPSVTESLYFLGSIDSVVGVTDYDTFPPDVSNKPSVGGNVDPSLEKIINLKPDLVIGEKIFHHDLLNRLQAFNIDTLELTLHHRLSHVKEAFFKIAEKVNRIERAKKVWQDIDRGLGQRRSQLAARIKKPTSMLVIVWHDPLIVAGGWSYIGDIMNAIGIKNAADSKKFSFPVISREELLLWNPDVILLVQTKKGMSINAEEFMKVTGNLPLKAKIVSFESEVLLHPGPRVLESADVLIKAIDMASKEEANK